jgi:hypothetical protein
MKDYKWEHLSKTSWFEMIGHEHLLLNHSPQRRPKMLYSSMIGQPKLLFFVVITTKPSKSHFVQ